MSHDAVVVEHFQRRHRLGGRFKKAAVQAKRCDRVRSWSNDGFNLWSIGMLIYSIIHKKNTSSYAKALICLVNKL